MSLTAPVFLVDDDLDNYEIMEVIFKELGYKNELIHFQNGEALLGYLKHVHSKPFLILCDVNIPIMDGFELKEKILEDGKLNYKSIPFIFLSTIASEAQIKKAYDLGGHGFFIKEN